MQMKLLQLTAAAAILCRPCFAYVSTNPTARSYALFSPRVATATAVRRMAVAGVAGGANPRVPSHFQGGLPYRKRSASASLADLESLVSDDELEELLDATLSFKPREAVLQSCVVHRPPRHRDRCMCCGVRARATIERAWHAYRPSVAVRTPCAVPSGG